MCGLNNPRDNTVYVGRSKIVVSLVLLCSCVQEWARNTGRWSDGDPPPYFAQLKTRLRCAFNKAPDIDEVKEMHARNCEEPYKVYRFTTRKGTCTHSMLPFLLITKR